MIRGEVKLFSESVVNRSASTTWRAASGSTLVALIIAVVSVVVMVSAESAHATPGVGPTVTFDAFNPLPANDVAGRKWFSGPTVSFAVTVNANGEPGPPQLQCKLDDGELMSCPGLVQNSPTTYTFTYSLLDGPHDVTLVAEDNDGDSTDVTALVGVDTQDPLVTFERPVGPVVRTTLPYFTSEFSVFDGFAGVAPTADCRLDGATWEPCTQTYTHSLYGIFKHPVAGMNPGQHTFDVRAVDNVNRTATATLTIHVQSPGDGVDVEMSSSTTQSAAHPDLRIDVQNNTSQDLTAFSYKLPDGLFGSLAGVPGQTGDGSRCPYPVTPDFFTGCEEAVKQSSRVGSVDAVVDLGGHRVRLDGTVHLVDPYLAGEPAGLVFAVNAKLGGLDFGTIVVPARVVIQPTELDPMVYEDIVRSPTGLTTTVDNVPNSIEDPEHGSIDFTLKRLTIDIQGEVAGGPQPFLTNPSSCDTGSAVATVVTDDGDTHLSQPDYTATGCDTVAFAPSIDQLDLTSYTFGNNVGMTINVHLPDENSTIEGVQVDLPNSLAVNNAAFGVKCSPSQSMILDPEDELNGGCPDSTRIGTATINTPLLTAPIAGIVYLEDSGGTLPYLYINVRDSSLGVNARLRASNVVVPGGPNGHVRTTLDVFSDGGPRSIASVPVTDFTLDLPGTHQGAGGSLTPLFKIDTRCNSVDFAFAKFSSHAQPGSDLHQTISPPLNITGCNENTEIAAHESLFTPVNGEVTDSTSAAFRLNWGGGGSVTFRCSLDGANYDTNCGIGGGVTTGVVQLSGLSDGVHKFVVSAGSTPDIDVFTWKVDTTAARDMAPPSTPTLTSGPADGSTTADRTPTWQFTSADTVTATGALKFECRVNNESFLGCGTGSPGQFTAPDLPAAAALFNGDHSFAVRVSDEYGNVSPATTVDFTVGSPLAPTLTGAVSDASAGGHPAVTLLFGNQSNEDVRDLTLSLPNEMAIDPNSAAEVCTYNDAVLANCPVDSEIASAEAEVQVDRTTFTFPGEVFIVEAPTVGDLNRLAVVIDPTLGPIDFGSRIVSVGQAVARTSPAGVDFVFTSLPKSVVDVPKTSSMDFRLRSLQMQFDESPDGVDPQFTNPPTCGTRSFGLSLTTYGNNNASAADPFTLSGCSQPPPVVNITSPAAGGVTNDSTPTLGFTVSDLAASCEVDVDGGSASPVTSGSSLPTLTDGDHSVHVNCTNSAGGGSDTNSFRVDTTAPSVVISTPANGSSTSDSTPSLDYTVSDAGDATPSCNLVDGSNLGQYATGPQSVTVTCTDDAGNAGTATNTFAVVAAGFSPSLAASLAGRGGVAPVPGKPGALTLSLTTAPGDEMVASFTVDLPPVVGVSVAGLPDVLCEVPQASAGTCPAASRVGGASAASATGALAGAVFMLRGASASTPDLAVVFAGQSNWLRGSRTVAADGRARISFAGQPAPLPVTNLSLSIDGFFIVAEDACGPINRSLGGTATSESSKSATFNSQVSVEGGGLPAACDAGLSFKSKFKNSAKRSTLSMTVTSSGSQKLKKLAISLPAGLKQVKKALAKKLIVKADGKRLAAKCFKFRSASKLEVGLCGKSAARLEITYKTGSLTAVKKVTGKSKLTLVATPVTGTPQTLKPALAAR